MSGGGWLLDVNFILASRWTTHADHPAARSWLDSVGEFHACAITELRFVRISLRPAYQATWDETQQALTGFHARPAYRFLADDVNGAAAPPTGARDTTDAHLVTLAKRPRLTLATLDTTLLTKSWAAGLAVNPLLSPEGIPGGTKV